MLSGTKTIKCKIKTKATAKWAHEEYILNRRTTEDWRQRKWNLRFSQQLDCVPVDCDTYYLTARFQHLTEICCLHLEAQNFL